MTGQVLDILGDSDLIVPAGAVITPGERVSRDDFNRNTLMALRLEGVERFSADYRFHRGFRLAALHLTNWYGDKVEVDYITYHASFIGDLMPGLNETLYDLSGVYLQIMVPACIWYFDIGPETAEKVIMGEPKSPYPGLRPGSNCGLSLDVWRRMAHIVRSVM